MFLSETSEKLLLINMKKKELFVATRDSLKKVKTSKIQNFALLRNTFIWIDSQGNVFEIPWNKIESKKIASNVSNLYWLGSDGVILLLYDHDQRNTSLTTDGIYFSEEVYHWLELSHTKKKGGHACSTLPAFFFFGCKYYSVYSPQSNYKIHLWC